MIKYPINGQTCIYKISSYWTQHLTAWSCQAAVLQTEYTQPSLWNKKSSSFKWYAFQTLSKAVKVTKINASFMGPSVSMKLQCACRLFKMVKLIWKTLKCWSLQLRHQTGEAFWPALVVYCAEGKRQLPHPDSLPWPWFQGFSLSAQCLCAGQVLH